jgi:hypothetical protein
MFAAVFVALRLVHFYGPDQQLIEINPDEVVAIREPRDSEKHFHQEVHCLVFTSDGKFVAVQEDCETVEQRLTIAAPDKPPPKIDKN